MPWLDAPIATERLRLRAFGDSDRPMILRRLIDPDVRRYLGGPAGDDVIEVVRVPTVGERWGAFCMALATTDEPIGACSFDRERGELEVSYDLLPEHWGAGYATEAVAAAIAWVWSVGDDASMIAVTQSANAPSLRLLRRLGFADDVAFEEFGEMQSQLRLDRPAADPI